MTPRPPWRILSIISNAYDFQLPPGSYTVRLHRMHDMKFIARSFRPLSRFNQASSTVWLSLAALVPLVAMPACSEARPPATCDLDRPDCGPSGHGGSTPRETESELSPRTDSPLFARRGPNRVAYRTVTEGTSNLHLWYPSEDLPEADSTYNFQLQLEGDPWDGISEAHASGQFAQDGTLATDAGKLPVVLFSHGFATSPEWYSSLLEHYASHGYLVVSSLHPESDWLSAAQVLRSRPLELTRALDLLETSKGDLVFLRDHIDWRRITVMGHSLGGYTALALGGARIAPANFDALCSGLSAEDPRSFLCAPFAGQESLLLDLFGLDDAPKDGVYPSLLDGRIDAIVTMAGDAYLFAEQGLHYLELPILSLGGTVDFGTPYELGAQLTYDAVQSQQKWLVGLSGGSHMLPANHCDLMVWPRQLPAFEAGVFCEDPVWDRERALDLIKHYSLAFLEAVPGEESEAQEALGENAAFTGVEFRGTQVAD